jgi:hypothetical protein
MNLEHEKLAVYDSNSEASVLLSREEFLSNLGKRLSSSLHKLVNDQPDWKVPVSPKHEYFFYTDRVVTCVPTDGFDTFSVARGRSFVAD